MNRLAVVALMLCLTAVSPCLAGVPTNKFTIHMRGGHLAVSKGQLVFGGSAFGYWYVSATQIKSSVGGSYLAYDPKGESNAIVLKSAPGEGTEWSIDVPGRGRASEGKRAVIRAAKGPKKGCYLTVAEGRAILVKDPPRKLQAERWWEHK